MFLVVPKTRITLTRERSSPEISWCWTLEGLERTDLLARAALIRKIISCEFGQGVEPVLLWPQPDVPSRLHVSVSGFSPFSKIKKKQTTQTASCKDRATASVQDHHQKGRKSGFPSDLALFLRQRMSFQLGDVLLPLLVNLLLFSKNVDQYTSDDAVGTPGPFAFGLAWRGRNCGN